MNQKRAKALRQSMREAGIDPADKKLEPAKAGSMQRRLDVECGRSRYQRTKHALTQWAGA